MTLTLALPRGERLAGSGKALVQRLRAAGLSIGNDRSLDATPQCRRPNVQQVLWERDDDLDF